MRGGNEETGMPRRARLDLPNLLHHVMARGIEGGVIFRDIRGREEFLRRLSHDFTGNLEEMCQDFRVWREQILGGSRARDISRARSLFFLRTHQEAGQSFTGLGRLCGFSHTSVREAIAKARMEEQEEK